MMQTHQTSVIVDDDPQVDELITLFDNTFYSTFNTRLVRGGDEPVYLPAGAKCDYAQIIFAHGYFSSALHEIAHWCLAGDKRRLREDYGYWYCPDGRNAQQQKQFEQVEIKPQAIEKALTLAAGRHFRVSTDNLSGAQPDTVGFTQAVNKQFLQYQQLGFPSRAELFIRVIKAHFSSHHQR